MNTYNFCHFRYDPLKNSYHLDMDGNGIICQAVDILPTEFAKEVNQGDFFIVAKIFCVFVSCFALFLAVLTDAKQASQHFGDILSKFIGSMASTTDIRNLPAHLRRACIAHRGALTHLYEYISRMRDTDREE